MSGWEYMTQSVPMSSGVAPLDSIDRMLNEQAVEGWELFHVLPVQEGGKTIELLNYYRRPMAPPAAGLPESLLDLA